MALIFTLEFVLKTVVYFFLSLNILGRDHSFSTHAKSTNSINMIDWVPRTQYCAAKFQGKFLSYTKMFNIYSP